MKKIFLFTMAIVAMIFTSIFISACTDEQMAKSWGGTATIELPEDTKLVNVTWKEGDDLWILTRKMKANETADTLEFFQHTGKIFKLTGDGKVILVEKKSTK